MTVQTEYRRIRAERPDVPARWALDWARTAVEVEQVSAAIDWSHEWGQSIIAVGELDGVELRIYADDEPYEWGDLEPSEADRDNLEVIGIGVRVAGDEDDLDSLWSIGYLDGRMEYAALLAAIEHGMLKRARREASERAYWSARDVETVA